MKVAGIVFAHVGAYFVVRAVVKVVMIDYGDAASYQKDWGAPWLLGVLAVHCLPGVVAFAFMLWGARRLRREHSPISTPGISSTPSEFAGWRTRVAGQKPGDAAAGRADSDAPICSPEVGPLRCRSARRVLYLPPTLRGTVRIVGAVIATIVDRARHALGGVEY